MKPEVLLVALTVVAGLGGLVFVALRFNREDAKSVVDQQSTLLHDMRAMNDELVEALARCRERREELGARLRQTEEAAKFITHEHARCGDEIDRLTRELAAAQEQLRRMEGA